VQLAEFSACVLLARAACGLIIGLIGWPLGWIAALLDHIFVHHPTALLFFVMIACPVLMNLAQAWIQDAHLIWGGSQRQSSNTAAYDALHLRSEAASPVLSEASEARGIELMEARHGSVSTGGVSTGASSTCKRVSSHANVPPLEREGSWAT
jgi:STIMATE family